jgi:hypothetical protein
MSEATKAIQKFIDGKLDKDALVETLANIDYKDPSHLKEAIAAQKRGDLAGMYAAIEARDPQEEGTFYEVKAAWAMEKLPDDVYFDVLDRIAAAKAPPKGD